VLRDVLGFSAGRRKRDDPANQRGVGQRGAPTCTRSARPATDRLLACASSGLAAGTRDRRPLGGSGRARRDDLVSGRWWTCSPRCGACRWPG
jgi:hypothetical protein